MKHKFLTVLLALAAALCLCFGLAACREEGLVFRKQRSATGEETMEVAGISMAYKCDIVIPSTYSGLPVTSIASDAFYGCKNIMSVTIPDSVTGIGSSAFSGCSGLTSITIPASVSEIGSGAFFGCYKLIEVWNYSDLEIVAGDMGNGHVGYYAKHIYTTNVESKQTTTSDGYIFYEDGDEAYLLGYSGNGTQLKLPDKSPSGKNYEIYRAAFYERVELTNIEIPGSVTSVGELAFYGCSGLERITVDTNNPNYSSQDGILYNKEKTEFVCIPPAIKGAVTIPDGLTSIGDEAFVDRRGLTSITIPDSVTEIGQYAFFRCIRLTDIRFEGTVEAWQAIEKRYDWDYYTGDYTVACTGGTVDKKGNVT